jgi:heptosyltransferase III
VVPATAAGVLAALQHARARGVAQSRAPVGPPGWAAAARHDGFVAAPVDLELLCPRPIHHALELAGLYGLLEAMRTGAPGLHVRVWLRSALDDDAVFQRLPAAQVARLPEIDGGAASEACGAVLAALGGGGPARVLLGRDAGCERRLDGVGAWYRAELPRDFQWRLPDGPAAAAAAGAFFVALQEASPRWVTRPLTEPAAASGRAATLSRVLVYQARSHLGDALWLTPLLRELHERWPDAEVSVLATAAALPALAGNPHVGELLTLPPETGAAAEPARRNLLQELAHRRFDAALLAFCRRPQARWLAEAAAELGIRWRINLEYFDAAGDGRSLSPLFTHEGWFFWGTLPSPRLLLHALDPLPGSSVPSAPCPSDITAPRSAIQAGPGIWGPTAASPCRLELAISAASEEGAAEALAATGIGEQPFAVLAPAARSSARWPARKFAWLALHLAEDLGLHVLIEAGRSRQDGAVLAEVKRSLEASSAGTGPHARSRRAAGRAGRIAIRQDPLGTLAALLARARLLVANDSAPIHLAAIAGTPTLYFAHREKLVHSHPGGPRCIALYDAARNRPARIAVSAVAAAVAVMIHDGLIPAFTLEVPAGP